MVQALERMRRWLTSRRQDRAQQAHNEILAINDPLAAEPLVAMLNREDVYEVKRLWIQVAAQLEHPAAIDALVQLSLCDPDESIRTECLEYLIKSGRQGIVTPYIRALRSKDNEIINRAGAALGQIGNRDAIGPLIEALVTKQRVQVEAGSKYQNAYSFSPTGGGGSYNFGSSPPKFEIQSVRNPAVLSALVSLSGGTSFDYNQPQWRCPGWPPRRSSTAWTYAEISRSGDHPRQLRPRYLTTAAATRSSKLGRNIVSNSRGKNHASAKPPPLWACQNCVPSITAAEQEIKVPRFFLRRPQGETETQSDERSHDRIAVNLAPILPHAAQVLTDRKLDAEHLLQVRQKHRQIDRRECQRNHQQRDHRQHPQQESPQPSLPVEADPNRQQKDRVVDRANGQADHASGPQRPAVQHDRPHQ